VLYHARKERSVMTATSTAQTFGFWLAECERFVCTFNRGDMSILYNLSRKKTRENNMAFSAFFVFKRMNEIITNALVTKRKEFIFEDKESVCV
jgi:hypothetical protein